MSWAAAAQIGAQIFDKGLDQYNANRAFSKNKWLAREQIRFQERMASTQYQRAAKDLEAAGLNRVLALGSPAAAPAGATATYQQAKTPKLDLMAIASAKEAIEGQKQQNRILKAQADKEEITKTPYRIANDYIEQIDQAVKDGVTNAKDAIEWILDRPAAIQGALSSAGSSAKEVYDDVKDYVGKIGSADTPAEQRQMRKKRSSAKRALQNRKLTSEQKSKARKQSERRQKRSI